MTTARGAFQQPLLLVKKSFRPPVCATAGVSYKIAVKTGSAKDAGTNAPVSTPRGTMRRHAAVYYIVFIIMFVLSSTCVDMYSLL